MNSSTPVRDYSSFEIDNILEHPETVRREPYKVFTAYVWDALQQQFQAELEDNADEQDDSEDEEIPQADPNGKVIDIVSWRELLKNCVDDMYGAASNGSSLQIRGKSYRIPNGDYPLRKLRAIFDFEENGDEVTIDKSNIKAIVDNVKATAKTPLQQTHDDRLYFKKIVLMAEDEEQDGWSLLTDMEAAAYYWGFMLDKYNGTPATTVDLTKVFKTIQEECEIDAETLVSCFRKPLKSTDINVACQFSAAKIRDWNAAHNQTSQVDNISETEAEYHWEHKTLNFNTPKQ